MTDENTAMEATEEEDFSFDDLMSPEEMATLKALKEKAKNMKAGLEKGKGVMFEKLVVNFAERISQASKDVVTVSTKEPYTDGNLYSITFGAEEKKEAIDTNALAKEILDEYLTNIEQFMGLSDSVRFNGQYQGEKVYFQIRKRKKA